MSNSLGWFLNATRLGVSSDYDDDVSRRIVFSNVVFLSLPIVYFIFMVIDYQSYLKPFYQLNFDQFVVPIVILGCIFSLWLNYVNQTIISRVLFLVLWPLLLHIIPIWLLQTPPDYYLAFPVGIIFHGILVQLMFSFRKERALFFAFLSVNFLGLIGSPSILIYFSEGIDLPLAMINNEYYFLDALLYWLLFNLVMFYIIYTVESYIKKVGESKMLIEEQKEELNTLNQNLEMLVSQRTSQLEERNEQLQQHAFYNAHLLRGPFSSIAGLVELQKSANLSKADQEEIKTKLDQSIKDLDARIREIQRLVETDN